MANKQYSSNDYELTFDNNSIMTLCIDGSLPQIKYNFIELSRLFEVEVGSSIDIMAVVKECGSVQSIMTKKQTEINKRDVTFVDASGWAVKCTLWGNQADSFNYEDSPVVALKSAKVSDYNGRTLGVSDATSLVVNPDVPEAHRLRGWYDSKGTSFTFQSYSKDGASSGGSNTLVKNISQLTEEGLGMGEKADWVAIMGTIVYIRSENGPWYPACPSASCNKKVTETGSGWRCEKCDSQYPEPMYRYLLPKF